MLLNTTFIEKGQCPIDSPLTSNSVYKHEGAESTRSEVHLSIQEDLEQGSACTNISRSSSTNQPLAGHSDNVPGEAQKPKEPRSASHAARQESTYWRVRASLWLRSVRWRGILAMIAGVFAQSLSWGMNMAYGTILAFYCEFLIPDVSKTLAALAGTIPPFCLMSLSLPWGRLLDAGYKRTLNILAGVFLTVGMVSLAFTGTNDYNSGKYWAIVLASIPLGIGQSIYVLTAPRMAITWYPKHKGLAMGITNCGAAIGGVSWPLIFDTLVEARGFRGGVACLAGIAGALAIFITIFSIPAPDFKPHAIGNVCNFRNWWPTRAFRSKVFVIHIISMCFVYFGVLTIPFFVELWAQSNVRNSVSEDVTTGTGIKLEGSPQLGVYLLVTLNACQIPGRLFGSTMCDRFRARMIHAIACFIAVVVVGSCWFTITTYQGALGFVALFGLTLGVMVSLPNNDVQDLLGNERTYLFGQYSGTVYTCCSPFVLSGAVTTGALVQYFGVKVAPAVLCMGCFFVAGCGLILGLVVEDDTACFEEGGGSVRDGWTRIGSATTDARVETGAVEKR